jgi:hypothetical protein
LKRTTSLLESVIFSRRDFFEEEFTKIIRHPERYPPDDFLRLAFVLFNDTQIPERAIPALFLHFLGDVGCLDAESTIRRESFFFMRSCIPMQDMKPRDENAIWTPSLADFVAFILARERKDREFFLSTLYMVIAVQWRLNDLPADLFDFVREAAVFGNEDVHTTALIILSIIVRHRTRKKRRTERAPFYARALGPLLSFPAVHAGASPGSSSH